MKLAKVPTGQVVLLATVRDGRYTGHTTNWRI